MQRLLVCALVAGLLAGAAGCGEDDGAAPPPRGQFVSGARIVYADGLHNENAELLRLGDRILLAFRGGEEGQVGSARARIKIFESRDGGRTFTPLSEVTMPKDTGDENAERDIRDPKLVLFRGRLFLYAISRLPGLTYRDLFGEAWTVRAESADGGRTWTRPVKTYADVSPGTGIETFWGFWRFTVRRYVENGQPRETLFATGYNDGDTMVGLFASEDGVTWTRRGYIIRSYDDVPSEAELNFFGPNQETAVSIVRLDNQGVLHDGQSAICTARAPFATWECGRRIEQRLDGPSWIVHEDRGRLRHFVFARKHLPCTFKRTAAYELRGDLADPAAPVEVCEIQELPSAGDTAYTAVAPLGGSRFLLAWYSNPIHLELPWLEGQFSPSDIWLATVDLRRAPAGCTPPPPKRPCPTPPLPAAAPGADLTGRHLLTLAAVIWPAEARLHFAADIRMRDGRMDVTLQTLDGLTLQPVGDPWVFPDVPVAADGTFVIPVGSQAIPVEAFRLFDNPFLRLEELALTGRATSADGFCGYVTGYAQVLPRRVSDRIDLLGSTFGAVRITGDSMPARVAGCP